MNTRIHQAVQFPSSTDPRPSSLIHQSRQARSYHPMHSRPASSGPRQSLQKIQSPSCRLCPSIEGGYPCTFMLMTDYSAYRIFVRRLVVFVLASDIFSDRAHFGYDLRDHKALFNEVPRFEQWNWTALLIYHHYIRT